MAEEVGHIGEVVEEEAKVKEIVFIGNQAFPTCANFLEAIRPRDFQGKTGNSKGQFAIKLQYVK